MSVVAVLSDIHGNYVAFQKCVEWALEQGADTFFFLGDYLGELAYPERTMELLYKMKQQYLCFFVKGNKEEYWLNYADGGETGWRDGHSTTGSLLYTYSRLSQRDKQFFQNLPISRIISIPKMPQITICHGSPNSVKEKMLPNKEQTYEYLNGSDSNIILCGHTHIQSKIVCKTCVALNPGSVGVPLYSKGKAQFLLLHKEDGEWREEFVSLSYDVERVIADLHQDGLDKYAPYWCQVTEYLLRKGDISHGEVLARAMELCRAATGVCRWPEVPEEYWKQAVEEMIE